MSCIAERKPHAVVIPFPVQGHINPLFKIAKLLHLKGFHITFVHTEYNYKRLLKSRDPNALEFDGIPHFCFETIPDGLPQTDADDVTQRQDLLALCYSVKNNFLPFCRDLLHRLNHSATATLIPPVTCLISDCFMSFSVQAAQEFALPIVLSCPSSAAGLLTFMHFRTLFDKGIIPIKDESYLTNGYLDTKIDFIPGLESLRLKDLLVFIRTDPKDFVVEFVVEAADTARKASAIVINTFDELESDVFNALSSIHPSIYPVGPLTSFLNQNPHDKLAFLGSNLWKEDTEYLKWLESKEPRSVIYVNFGSLTVMPPEKLLEFAWGLANSKKPFLWIIRPDLVIGGSFILSSEFVNETKDRGLIASWCPQEQVLNHPSIGGFLTHCGWNSTIESISVGVPMLCWPYSYDHTIICRYICNEWDIGIEIDTNVKREEVEKLIHELMVGEKGKKLWQNIMELKKKGDEQTRPGGRSYMNLDRLIKDVLLKQNQI